MYKSTMNKAEVTKFAASNITESAEETVSTIYSLEESQECTNALRMPGTPELPAVPVMRLARACDLAKGAEPTHGVVDFGTRDARLVGPVEAALTYHSPTQSVWPISELAHSPCRGYYLPC